MTILVVGRTGQVAQALARQGVGRKLVCLGRPDLDIADQASLASAFENYRPELVINASAYTAVDKAESEEDTAYAVNEAGPKRLADLCSANDVPLIHYSTDYVFDGTKDAPYDEGDPTVPLGVYGRSKRAGENAIESAAGRHVILRTAWVYSPFGNNFVKTMLRLAENRDQLTIVADQIGCPTSAVDIADATFKIVDSFLKGEGVSGTFHLAGTGETSWCGFASEIFRVSDSLGGASCEAVPITTSEYPTPAARPANSRLNCAKVNDVYGITMPNWQQSLRGCVQELITGEEST